MGIALLPSTGEPAGGSSELIRVLVIDDDACVGKAIQAILDRRRCETVLASRACAGIDMLHQSRFDVVLLDVFMPGLSGLNAIEYIRREWTIPIIAMSGFPVRNLDKTDDHLAIAARCGATLCMRKPFKPLNLIEAVEWSVGLLHSFEEPIH